MSKVYEQVINRRGNVKANKYIKNMLNLTSGQESENQNNEIQVFHQSDGQNVKTEAKCCCLFRNKYL